MFFPKDSWKKKVEGRLMTVNGLIDADNIVVISHMMPAFNRLDCMEKIAQRGCNSSV